MIPGLLGGQVDPWRQQLQQMYAGGTFGGRNGYEALSGPATMQAYAMSGQGRYLNPTQEQPGAGQGQGQGAGVSPLSGLLGGMTQGGGILAEMIRRGMLEQQQALSGNGTGGTVRIPSNPLAPIRTPGGGLLGAY